MGFSFKSQTIIFFLYLSISTAATVQLVQAISSCKNTSSSDDNGGFFNGGRKLAGKCNWFRGRWVYDAKYPLYDPYKCPFVDPQFNCKKYGRPDSQYLKYRWQPSSCSLPRFNGLYFLRRMRGKKIMFVGDSLSSNMWQSLACLIYSWVPNSSYSLLRQKGLTSLTFQDYKVTLLLYRTQFLVDLDSEKVGRVLKLDSIKQGDMWRGMDVLIFNTWHWWTHTERIQPFVSPSLARSILSRVSVGLHARGEETVQRHGQVGGFLQRLNHVGQVGQCQCRPFQDQGLLQWRLPHPLRGKGLERAVQDVFGAEGTLLGAKVSGRDANVVGGGEQSDEPSEETGVLARHNGLVSAKERCAPFGL
ncbi:PREDICTED: protein trichome birefringence-like 39 isoform X4 [Tarenaya hassleriana]|uniref:protein trichome birefringence-like 39 isoform X4 n=1 Tax=Tarenaya hassleriana TaxID=28532 RepID=UPI00053C16E7|nr:PREDICTED: protein trichome birefringence-like 39 isoform X4 [Tarenaya hassleriana]